MNTTNQLDLIKHSWYHTTPNTLYSLCIQTIVRNVNTILVKKNNQLDSKHHQHSSIRLKYRLNDSVSILPNNICQSILQSYAQHYLDQLGRLERTEFFQIQTNKNEQMQTDQPERIQLIAYFDLLLAFATRPDKIYLNKIEYKQCIWSSSTLEQRLRTRIQNDLLSDSSIQQLNSNYFRLYSASSQDKFVLKSIRAQQQSHLEDKQLKLIIKNQLNRCQHLDICPCLLTNKSVALINKCNNLKYLRLQNCCDWTQKLNETDLDEEEEEIEDESDLDTDLKSYFETLLTNLDQTDDSDDTGEFDAYLEEYLNQYDSNETTEHKNKRRRHHHHHRHRKHKRNKNQKTSDDEDEMLDFELFLSNSARLSTKPKKIKKESTKCKLFKLNKQAKQCRKSLRAKLNTILNKTSKPKSSNECDREANSLIKWLVQNTIKNTEPNSIIEQIKQRASQIAETKMIDKVSISSSNYDDNDKKGDDLDYLSSSSSDNLSFEGEKTTNLNQNESSSSCTSCSSSSTSSSSTDYSDSEFYQTQTTNSTRFVRQQRLLDKVANLGSSPINVIQSIAAKALKFKLKNSVSFAQLESGLEQQNTSETVQKSTKYNRLLRQYKFFKSTHISSPNKATTSKAANTEQIEHFLTKSKQPSNTLFSVFKYWMTNKPIDEPIEDTSLDKSSSSSSSIDSFNSSTKLKKSLNLFTKSLQAELFTNNLQHLSLRNLGTSVIDIKQLNNIFKNLTRLKLLDISNCCTNQMSKQENNETIGLLDGLLCLKATLTHLLMADLNVDDIQSNLKFLLKLKQLKHLDLSNCREKPPVNMFKNASLQLAKFVYHLDKLTHLDISGTNLGGTSIFKEQEEIDYIKKKLYEDLVDEFNDYQRVKLDDIETIKSDCAGLMFLNNEQKMLQFFGCFSCDNAVSAREHLPAIKIAGEDCEKNLYTSLEAYVNDRPLFVLDALNHLFEAYRDELVEEKLLGGHLIMNTMEKNLDNSRIQISGSASLFYVLKYWKEENVQLPPFYLKRLIQTVINGMEEHIDEPAMRRNCVLIMCRLNLPDDVLFVTDRLIKILLKIFDDYIEDRNKNPSNDRQEHFVLRTAMHLLNILACSVHGSDKSLVGSQAIPIAMNLIKTKTKFKEADDILEVTWSFLWNITDETQENCKIFLDCCEGMSAFMDCIQFKKTEITRNMMGLLGNVAEVKQLRNRLCKNDYISTFRQLLFYSNDGIEIPYNSAGVLVHILSDGLDAWLASECHEHDRQLVIEDIENAIDKWDLQSERNINYRSFEPIFRLVNQYESPICQRWACWALANLTTVYPDVYCQLFEKENGRLVLDNIISNAQVNDAVKKFSRIVLSNVDKKLNSN